ncbi:MAG TPA: LPS export ABC transporter periplasmic protein LptC [Spirochaetota bacterium]|nr:LPS export ABC transporter periplasmic protein LptC [Spirochaetota bacterium]HOL56725.1 LPS export ABC transporter periplasmic protein LptC [Spirochaetota bacterium]HPP04120.1 LPS export ABC transporter periplasmic protein LptC [Spirochaetota bacterium]
MKIRFLILIIFIFSCSNSKVEKITEKEIFPDMTQKNYEHFIYKNGKKYLYTKIDFAKFFDKKNKIECESIYAIVYNSKGEKKAEINADYSYIDQETKNVTFKGNIKIKMIEEKATLYTEELFLNYKDNKMSSNTEIFIEKEDGSYLKASSMESDINKQDTSFNNLELKYYYEDNTNDKK